MSADHGGLRDLVMDPATGGRRVAYVGDRLRFTLGQADGSPPTDGSTAFLRTNLGRAARLRAEITAGCGAERGVLMASWRDIPMERAAGGWAIEMALTEVGYFKAKAYAVDSRGWQVWPEGSDFGVSVHPDRYRCANTIYCAFPRLMGGTRSRQSTADAGLERRLRRLEQEGYAVLPPSGTLRDLAAQVPHIVDGLGCRILHLLPINPTPTTLGRFGRLGSPYAGLDLTAIDPALIAFDRRKTGVEQFRELAGAVHGHGARLVLDLVINHTGWSSTLQEAHPEWFLREPDGTFRSPGAWGTVWEDLVELDESHRPLWDEFAEAFLTWCRRGVDGFRCDAGYQVPMPVWCYVTARVRQEFPDTLFLLEGLGGAWDATELMLTEGGMQWAYSELFQEYSGLQVSGYLDHALKQSQRVGTLVHYSETHDNERLAKKGRSWSRLRNRLCALTSVNGAFGFTCGVEWLATEKIKVHGCTGLAWGNADNLLDELGRLNRLLADHPCFFDGARLTRLSPPGAPIYALRREAAESADVVLVLLNTNAEAPHAVTLDAEALAGFLAADGRTLAGGIVDLLDATPLQFEPVRPGSWSVSLAAGAGHCLAPTRRPQGLAGDEYRRSRAWTAWAVQALARVLDPETIGPFDWRALAATVERDPAGFLGSLWRLEPTKARRDLMGALGSAMADGGYSRVITWTPADVRRVTPVPSGHWVLLRISSPFRASLRDASGLTQQVDCLATAGGHVAAFPPSTSPGTAALQVESLQAGAEGTDAAIRFLAGAEGLSGDRTAEPGAQAESGLVLLTNRRGGMARLCVDFGRVTSKYDCLLGANEHPTVPVDRHVWAKRARAWVRANQFISPLNADTLVRFEPGPPPCWDFQVPAGDGQTVLIRLWAFMPEGQNTTVLRFERRPSLPEANALEVGLTIRLDLEDRNFHWETKRNAAADHHFAEHVTVLPKQPGFVFAPAPHRALRVFANRGQFHYAPEWSENIAHPLEATRGMVASGDAYSPGWFELPLEPGAHGTVVTTSEPELCAEVPEAPAIERSEHPTPVRRGGFEDRLRRAIGAFLVRRGPGRTVIAGYPWFLDWGRDTLICARGLIAAGLTAEVEQLLMTFGQFESQGTLPNSIHGEDASNRETSDAALWYGLVCEEWVGAVAGGSGTGAAALYGRRVDQAGRNLADILHSIAQHYIRGTPVGVRMDPDSCLIWSPAHFTWMDTNHPAGTPREGYPIEIQALWIRLLQQLDRTGRPRVGESWADLARRAEQSLHKYYWVNEQGWWADVLRAGPGLPAAAAEVDDALRSNALFVVSLGIGTGDRARRTVEAARQHLVIPGGVRSLAPLPVRRPLEIRGGDGRLLNNPRLPYWGRYEGDEDTRRKPAYHNGTAWTWMLPVFAEALARAWDNSPESQAAAISYLLSLESLMNSGCLGQLPEVLDGDAPHRSRGCDAQAWSVTEALRVWRMFADLRARRPESQSPIEKGSRNASTSGAGQAIS